MIARGKGRATSVDGFTVSGVKIKTLVSCECSLTIIARVRCSSWFYNLVNKFNGYQLDSTFMRFITTPKPMIESFLNLSLLDPEVLMRPKQHRNGYPRSLDSSAVVFPPEHLR